MARHRRARLLALCAAALAAGLVAAIPAAQAVPAGAVTLPVVRLPDAFVSVRLVGATATRLLTSSGTSDATVLSTGTPALSPVSLGPANQALFLAGDTVVWSRVSGTTTTVHTTDLVTGGDTVETGTDRLSAAAPGLWIGLAAPQVALHSGGARKVLVPDLSVLGPVRADATSMVIAYRAVDATVHLDLVDLASGAVTPLGYPPAGLVALALTPSSVVWVTSSPHTFVRYDRATGTRTTRTADALTTDLFAATDGAVAYGNATALRIAPADPAQPEIPVAGSDALTSLVARGAGFAVTRDGAPSAGAGVLALSASGVLTPLVPAPAAPETYLGLHLDSGRVVYDSRTLSGVLGGRVPRVRTVSGDVSLSAGPESLLPESPDGVQLSGSRTTASSLVTASAVTFLDGGVVTGVVAGTVGDRAVLSGPYAVVRNAEPFRVDGSAVRLPAADGRPVRAALYGRRIVYVTATGAVRLLDAAAPLSPTNPRTLVTAAGSGDVAIAADTVGVGLGSGAARIVDVATGAVRSVPSAVAVGDGVALLASGNLLSALDLATPGASPVTLGSVQRLHASPVADDHRVAWVGGDGTIAVARLPFGAAHRPRLLGTVARAAFSPDGNGVADTWAPQFDFSKPLGTVTLTIRSGAAVIRTLTTTAPLGSVRGLVWDGLTDAGAAAPDGTYSWTLTGAALDGDGRLADVDGAGAVSGTVVVDRLAEKAVVTVPASSALVRATDGLPVSWRLTTPASRSTAVYDVRWRSVSWDAARKALAFDVVQPLRTGTTATSYVVPGPSAVPGLQHQFSVRVRDAAGNVGPWSAWVSGSRSLDDRNLARVALPWSSVASAGSFLGTTTTSPGAGAVLVGDVVGSRLYVWATTCPTCGRLVVHGVDATGRSFRAVVDTRSAATRPRVLVLSRLVPVGDWTVDLAPGATPGRPRVFVDGLGSAL